MSNDPYSVYMEGNIYSGNPVRLVIALYEGAIEAILEASRCLKAGDIEGRGRFINKTLKILTELLVSLDHEKGGEVSANLSRLYSYMQSKLLEAHARQQPEALQEVVGLLTNLLEGWQGVAEKTELEQAESEASFARIDETKRTGQGWVYGSGFDEAPAASSVCAVF